MNYKNSIIEHESFVNLYNKDNKIFDKLLKDVDKLSAISNKITKLSKSCQLYGYRESNKFKGDLFEIFGEMFFKLNSSNNRIAIADYTPVNSIDDIGVDATGVDATGEKVTIQIKFRSNVQKELIESDLNQFAFQSIDSFGIDTNTPNVKRMILFTNASDLNWFTKYKVFNDKILCYNYKSIKTLVDNNYPFWNNVNKMVEDTLHMRYNLI